jgi:hypothetical protein
LLLAVSRYDPRMPTIDLIQMAHHKLVEAVTDGGWWWFPCFLLALAVLSAAMAAVTRLL